MKRSVASASAILLLILMVWSSAASPFSAKAFQVDGGGMQACYSLDTSRPEWLQTPVAVYLPVVLKGSAP